MRKAKIRKTILILAVFLLAIANVLAQQSHDTEIEEGEELVESEISCDKVTDEQLEMIGEYYMEQMHPGEAHEIMDKMMGGDDSESLKNVHIQMAKQLYCNEDVGGMMGGGMMGSGSMMGMMNMMGGGMMGSGGMGMMGTNMMSGSIGTGSWQIWSIIGLLFWIALLALLAIVIIWLYKRVAGKAAEADSALNILKRRFAKGEITKKQFENMKKHLED